ncbi:MAG TPA: HD domain-containing protein [Longimicrobiales bacterium]|nr:HD domain-containing protein [Longimicrobiales bacterium]
MLDDEDFLAPPRGTVAERLSDRLWITVPVRGNGKLAAILEAANADEELYGLLLAANVNAMERLGMTDHGPVHVKIVMNVALKLIRILADRGVTPSVITNYGFEYHDAEVVVALASMLHDVGMSIHRIEHETFSLFIAQDKLRDLLAPAYSVAEAAVLRSEILHAIIAHRSGGRPLTVEAGVVRIADALDMAKGRSRIPFQAGSVSIHSVSAAAVEAVRIEPGDAKPVKLVIDLSNSAGVFQVDQLLREKLRGSGLEDHLEVEVAMAEGDSERRLVQSFRL